MRVGRTLQGFGRGYEVAAHTLLLTCQFFILAVLEGIGNFLRYALIPALSHLIRKQHLNALVGIFFVSFSVVNPHIEEGERERVRAALEAKVTLAEWMAMAMTAPLWSEVECLSEVLSRESDFRDSTISRAVVGEIVMKRRSGGVKAGFADTVCAVVWQPGQFTGMFINRWQIPEWLKKQNDILALEVMAGKYRHIWTKDTECALYYKRTDNVGTDAQGRAFFETKRPVTAFGPHTFYCDRPESEVRVARKVPPKAPPVTASVTQPEKKTDAPGAPRVTSRPIFRPPQKIEAKAPVPKRAPPPPPPPVPSMKDWKPPSERLQARN